MNKEEKNQKQRERYYLLKTRRENDPEKYAEYLARHAEKNREWIKANPEKYKEAQKRAAEKKKNNKEYKKRYNALRRQKRQQETPLERELRLQKRREYEAKRREKLNLDPIQKQSEKEKKAAIEKKRRQLISKLGRHTYERYYNPQSRAYRSRLWWKEYDKQLAKNPPNLYPKTKPYPTQTIPKPPQQIIDPNLKPENIKDLNLPKSLKQFQKMLDRIHLEKPHKIKGKY